MVNVNGDNDSNMGDVSNSNSNSNSNNNSNNNNNNNSTNNNKTEEDATAIKRRAIQEIQRDPTLDARAKRFRIQQLMSGSASRSASASLSGSASGSDFLSTSIRHSHDSQTATATATTTTTTIIGPLDVMKCVHYEERKCNIVAPCCGQIFGCRVCHDEMVTDGHELNRFLVREVVCKECHTRQERSNECINCHIKFGEYHCNICNLWMDTTKQPFHCDKCGICRVGGSENFIHCDDCAMCINANTYDNHVCLKDKFKNSCPVCREDMHTSRHACLDLPCGHAIHTHCFRRLAAFDYRCPICKKTVVNPESMARAWQERAAQIASQQMPPDLARIVDIWCNDCEVKSTNRNWHFLGVQCPNCNSFNTAIENNVSRTSSSGN